MSDEIPNKRTRTAQEAVNAHLAERRKEALSKIKGTDSAAEKRRADIHESGNYQLPALLNAARLAAGQIQLASHLLKPTYPDAKARLTTNLKVRPSSLPKTLAVGSHVLHDDTHPDTTGNAVYVKKIYELNRLLSAQFENRSFLNWLIEGDMEVAIALGCIGKDASSDRAVLIAIGDDRCPTPASHSMAKQLYWLVGNDAHDESAFHLLAPLYPTLLVHSVYQQLQNDRFSEEAKAAGVARKAGTHHSRPVREYPQLAVQKLGGTKPQNISQLNSERLGDNCLLASVPPVWKSEDVRPPLRVHSLFRVYVHRYAVSRQVRALRLFLQSAPPSNELTRRKVREWVQSLAEELVQFQAELLTLEPGWSQTEDCLLTVDQRAWLDPDAQTSGAVDHDEAADSIASDFARWVNAQLHNPLPVGDPEFLFWRKLAREQFATYERESI